MGLNLYLKRIPTAADKQKMHSLIDAGRFDTLAEFLNTVNKTIHLGKFSAGWQFKFDTNDGIFYMPRRQEIINFCERNGYEVVGDKTPMSITEAFEMIDTWNADPKNSITTKSYFDANPDQFVSWLVNDKDLKRWSELGFNVNRYGTFINEGYEFDISTGWS